MTLGLKVGHFLILESSERLPFRVRLREFPLISLPLFLTEIPKNETKVILLEENYEPKVPKKNAKNNYNGRDRQFQKSQNNKSGDTKGFHRNGGDDSPYEKRYGSSGMSLCQNFRIFGVVLLTLVTLL